MKKIFDINTGHYKLINEGEQPQDAQQNDQENKAENITANTQKQNSFKSAEADETILNLQKQRQTLVNDYNQRIKAQNDNLLQVKKQISQNPNNYSNFVYDPAEVANDILSIENAINNLEKELADKAANIDSQIIQRKKALASEVITESLNAGLIPDKYHKYVLNESKLNQAKVYLDDIIFNENYDQIIYSLTDFKKLFSKSNLLYGKDKQGYFVVCADTEDYKIISSILRAIGYEKQDIETVLLPQVFEKIKMAIF